MIPEDVGPGRDWPDLRHDDGFSLGQEMSMALLKQMCANHVDRIAIGVCVITKAPICAECSTRYEGVNYSKEGLEIFKERRASEASGGTGLKFGGVVLAVILSPLLLYAHYLFFHLTISFFIDLQQLDMERWF